MTTEQNASNPGAQKERLDQFGRYLKRSYDRTHLVRERVRKWILISVAIGGTTGLLVAGLDFIISGVLFHNLKGYMAFAPLTLLLPIIGLVLATLVMRSGGREPGLTGTEEYISSFHEPRGKIDLAAVPRKIVAACLTVGLGGSAGLEGPSVNLGAAVGTAAYTRVRFLNLHVQDLKIMMIAGAAAGISAIFKAPLTGIVFALEVPYKDDLAQHALIPSLFASVTSYVVFVGFMGSSPILQTSGSWTVQTGDLVAAVLLGTVCGLFARGFVGLFRKTETYFSKSPLSPISKAAIGGTICGVSGLLGLWLLGTPFVALGTGYESVNKVMVEALSVQTLIGLVVLKAIATIGTLTTGGVGGVFIPMILLGGGVGALFGKLLPSGDKAHLFPIIGMSSFVASGYKTPLAAITFVAETTGSPTYIIPGLVAAAFGYTVSGRLSISKFQRWTRMTRVRRLASARVGEVMKRDVIVVPDHITIQEFIDDYLLKYRFKVFILVHEGQLSGVLDIGDVSKVEPSEWDQTPLTMLATKDVPAATPEQSLSEILDIMNAFGFDVLPVIEEDNPDGVVGMISAEDIRTLEEIADLSATSTAARGPDHTEGERDKQRDDG